MLFQVRSVNAALFGTWAGDCGYISVVTLTEWDSLPELNDGGAGVGQLGTGHVPTDGDVGQAGILAVLMVEGLDAHGRVPDVVTAGPGQGGTERLDQIVEAPGQNHDVVGVTEEDDHHGGIAQT